MIGTEPRLRLLQLLLVAVHAMSLICSSKSGRMERELAQEVGQVTVNADRH